MTLVVEAVFDDEDGALGVVDAVGDVIVFQQVIDGQGGPDLGAAEPGQDGGGCCGPGWPHGIFLTPRAARAFAVWLHGLVQLAVGQADVG